MTGGWDKTATPVQTQPQLRRAMGGVAASSRTRAKGTSVLPNHPANTPHTIPHQRTPPPPPRTCGHFNDGAAQAPNVRLLPATPRDLAAHHLRCHPLWGALLTRRRRSGGPAQPRVQQALAGGARGARPRARRLGRRQRFARAKVRQLHHTLVGDKDVGAWAGAMPRQRIDRTAARCQPPTRKGHVSTRARRLTPHPPLPTTYPHYHVPPAPTTQRAPAKDPARARPTHP
jgi:hypothetical protein